MTGDDETFRRKLTSFGRRKGKTLRSYHSSLMQDVLPQVELAADAAASPAGLFPPRCKALWLEIGFGGGEHLAADALRHRDTAFIGCEPFINGVAKLLAHVDEDGLDNVRIFPGDAREILARLPDSSVERVNILYPDPWPKTRQKKRRFISDETLVSLARVMKTGSALRFATDIDDYSAWTLCRILRSPHFDWQQTNDSQWLTPWEGWSSTRYEMKALREGRKPAYFTFHRNGVPVGA